MAAMGVWKILEKARKYTAMVGLGLGASLFWGALAMVIAIRLFDLDQFLALLFVAYPVAIVCLVWMWRKLPGLLGFDD